jgi:hypothetical protein
VSSTGAEATGAAGGSRELTKAPAASGPHSGSARSRLILLLAVLALTVRATHLVQIAETPLLDYHRAFSQSDMHLFHQWSLRIVGGDLIGRERYHPLVNWQLAIAPAEKWERWYGDSSPVFYKAPFYAYLLAVLYAIFGDSALPMLVLQALVSTLCVVLLFRIVEIIFDTGSAVAAAGLFALYAPGIHYDATLLRGPWIVLAALLVTEALASLPRRSIRTGAGLLGLATGFAVLVNEGFTPLLVLIGLALIHHHRHRSMAAGAAFYALGVALMLAPVVARNIAVGTRPFSIAAMGLLAVTFFNAAGSDPFFFEVRPAAFVPLLEAGNGGALATVKATLSSFGSVADAMWFAVLKVSGLAVPFESPDNVSFYYAALKSPLLSVLPGHRVVFPLAIVGVVLVGRRLCQAASLVPVFAVLTLSILLTIPVSRYRATWTVLLLPFAGFALFRVTEWARQRRLRGLVSAAAALAMIIVALATWERRILFAQRARAGVAYRPSEFWVSADVYERRGHLTRAAREMQELARLNPDPDVRRNSCLRLAHLAARSGQKDEVRAALQQALSAGGDTPFNLLLVGDAHLALLGDRETALACYQRAIVRGPPDSIRDVLRGKVLELTGDGR